MLKWLIHQTEKKTLGYFCLIYSPMIVHTPSVLKTYLQILLPSVSFISLEKYIRNREIFKSINFEKNSSKTQTVNVSEILCEHKNMYLDTTYVKIKISYFTGFFKNHLCCNYLMK